MSFTVILICISVFMSRTEWLCMLQRHFSFFLSFFPTNCPHPALMFYRVWGPFKLACRFFLQSMETSPLSETGVAQFLPVHRLQQLGRADPRSPAHPWNLLSVWKLLCTAWVYSPGPVRLQRTSKAPRPSYYSSRLPWGGEERGENWYIFSIPHPNSGFIYRTLFLIF